MSDEEESAVALGEKTPVEGRPLAQLSARFMWGIEKSEIERREGETTIRTPDGPRTLGDILADVEEPYFATQREFEHAVREGIGNGPIPTTRTADEKSETADETADGSTSTERGEDNRDEEPTAVDETDGETDDDTDDEHEDDTQAT